MGNLRVRADETRVVLKPTVPVEGVERAGERSDGRKRDRAKQRGKR